MRERYEDTLLKPHAIPEFGYAERVILMPEVAAAFADAVKELRAIAEMPVRWPTDETNAMQEVASAALARLDSLSSPKGNERSPT